MDGCRREMEEEMFELTQLHALGPARLSVAQWPIHFHRNTVY